MIYAAVIAKEWGMTAQFDVILLAAQRTGVVNPLAEAHGVSHKCLIPVAGEQLIVRTLNSVTSHPGCRAVHILIEPDGEAAVRPVAEKFAREDLEIHFLTSDSNIAESVVLGCRNGSAGRCSGATSAAGGPAVGRRWRMSTCII